MCISTSILLFSLLLLSSLLFVLLIYESVAPDLAEGPQGAPEVGEHRLGVG